MFTALATIALLLATIAAAEVALYSRRPTSAGIAARAPMGGEALTGACCTIFDQDAA